MNTVHHTEQVVKQAREFFDGWLDLFPAWTDFVQAVKSDRLPEFGGTGENTIRQVSDWLGGAAEAGVLEAELETIELSDYDLLCCMIDENLTQQHVGPKTIFEIVAAAIQEAEKMLRETKNVHEFNAGFKQSRGIPSLLQGGRCLDPDNGGTWRDDDYSKAKLAIEPSGEGLGRGFLRHFLPPHSVANNNTLQTAITAYYQERWREEGQKLMDESQRLLWQAKETNDQKKMDAAFELEKQARVLLGKVKVGGVSRALLEKLDSTSKMGDVVPLARS